jgi:hypothetical protein
MMEVGKQNVLVSHLRPALALGNKKRIVVKVVPDEVPISPIAQKNLARCFVPKLCVEVSW